MKKSKKVRQKGSKNRKISIIPYNGFFKFLLIFFENRKSKAEIRALIKLRDHFVIFRRKSTFVSTDAQTLVTFQKWVAD